jgi:outer membrane protein OmpA-like peptidoglycan-associated protein
MGIQSQIVFFFFCSVFNLINAQNLVTEKRLDSITIFFKSGNFEVNNSNALKNKINTLKLSGQNKIVITSYTDTIGSGPYNQELGRKRMLSAVLAP